MPLYRYQAKAPNGNVQSGTLSADSVMAASAIIRSKGMKIVHLSATGSTRKGSILSNILKTLNYSSGPSQRDVLDFTTQLAVMTRAGISIRAALDGIADQVKNQKWHQILHGIKNDVESGKQFSEAIAQYPKLFSPLYINMVRASEMSGSFAKMLDRIAAYLTQQLETRKMVIGAMIYPGIIGSMAVSVTIFLLAFVLPRFAMVFQGKEEYLPKPTLFLMGLSDFIVKFWYLVLIGFVVISVIMFLLIRTRTGKLFVDKAKLSTPVFKGMFRAMYINRSLHTMGELLTAGVPMLECLAITGDISGNIYYRQLWRSVYASVKEGKKVIQPLQKSQLYPRSVTQMIAAGEESGKLAEVLEEVAAFYSRILRDAIKTVTSMIEPIMIIMMGSVVGFIAMAIILPIFKMSSLVK